MKGIIRFLAKGMIAMGAILILCISGVTENVSTSVLVLLAVIAILSIAAGGLLIEVLRLYEQIEADEESRYAAKNAARKAAYDKAWAAYFRS